MDEKTKAVRRARERAMKISGKPDLVINRIPSQTLNKFKKYAKERFRDDYGMAFDRIVEEFFSGRVDTLYKMFANLKEQLLGDIADVMKRIEALEGAKGKGGG